MRHLLVEQDLTHIVRAVGSSLGRLDGKTLLITGGTGFIGTWLLETLSWLNDQQGIRTRTYVTSRSPDDFIRRRRHLLRPDIIMLRGDVRSFQYPDESCDLIIHAAGSPDPRASSGNPREVMDTIVDGTKYVLELATRMRVESFLFLSSGAVYGLQPPGMVCIPEDYTGAPDIASSRSSYGEAKRYAEMLCSVYRDSSCVPVRIARPFTFAGPYQSLRGAFAVSEFIRCCLRREPIRIQGDGTAIRSYCYAADLIAALWKILLASDVGSVFNVGSETEISIADLARYVVEISGSQVPVSIEGTRTPGQPPSRYVPDTTRLRHGLGLQLHYDLRQALERTIDWNRSALDGNAIGN